MKNKASRTTHPGTSTSKNSPELHRIELMFKSALADPLGEKIQRNAASFLPDLPEISIRTVSILLFQSSQWKTPEVEQLGKSVLYDPVLHEMKVDASFGAEQLFDWYVEVGFHPGVTDNVGRTAQEAFAMWNEDENFATESVHALRGFFIQGKLSHEEVQVLTSQLLMNPVIENALVIAAADWDTEESKLFQVPPSAKEAEVMIEQMQLGSVENFMGLSRQRTLALNEEEAQAILKYFSEPEIQKKRIAEGLAPEPTDVEVEMLAQTWSEHCKHKIFNASISYTDTTTGVTEEIHSLYKSCVQASTKYIRKNLGEDDWCISVFSDNAGVIRFNDDWNLVMKVETHNSPSALDPYGGALTGIVGVNRDTFGTGLGAELIFNTNVFCFADPRYDEELPPKLMPPRRIFEGVRLGVEHGGNKSGIPTVNGAVVFHERFLGKPLVFCGTGGLMPAQISGQPAHKKDVFPGDVIVMLGGRIGKDGIHGATFSSEALSEASPLNAVQIGDPIVQKRMFDFLLGARDQGLYRCITDNGAGGLSSSVGEMAEFCNGCTLELDKAPLKYQGLQPWEILVSEAQERMTLAVPPEHLDSLLEQAAAMSVEATALGTFNDSGIFKATWKGETVAFLDMEFVHDGVPTLKLPAVWTPPACEEPIFETSDDLTSVLHALLGRLNICSKEAVIRQYDHEVQGSSVIKPLMGVMNDAPADAAVLRPLLDSMEGVVVANGICPRYSDIDTYDMMCCAIDEAVRNIIAVGGTLKQIAGLDNFCWCDPVKSEKNPDGDYKLAQLVRANQALYDLTTFYGVPCISGKDSMKNDYRFGDLHIAIPQTVLFTTIGVIADVRKALSSDVKAPGDLVYLLGETRNELGGSEYYDHLGFLGANVPKVEKESAKERYQNLSIAMERQLLCSCHDCSDGGLAVALAEKSMGGNTGMNLNLRELEQACLKQANSLTPDQVLFSESQSRMVVTLSPEHQSDFESLFAHQSCTFLGTVTDSQDFVIRSGENVWLRATVEELKNSWKTPLSEII